MFKNQFISSIKAIVKHLAVAFLFFIVFISGIYFLFHNDIKFAIRLINKVTIETKESENKEIKIDKIKKRLIRYPSRAELWANIIIPDINVEAPVYQGDTLDIIKYGVGHYPGSYFPGEGSSILLAAHNSEENFMYLPKLQLGAKVILDTIYGKYTYEVYDTKIIKDDDEEALPISKKEEILMMYTCYPVNTIGHKDKRYVVYARLVGDE